MHPRVSLHQVAFLDECPGAFVEHCRAIGVANVTLVTPLLVGDGAAAARSALAAGGVNVECVNHPSAGHPDLENDTGEGPRKLAEAIELAGELGAASLYLLTGARGGLDWEAAAHRFAELIAPSIPLAEARGVALLVENANAFNADIHIAHTLDDAVRLAEIAGIGVCVDLHACWFESDIAGKLRRAMPHTRLVQVSDYVLGDRTTPCRAVPGDGAIPLERLVGEVLEAGYMGVFDLELIGPRITAEGARTATARAADYLSNLLTKLGA